MIALEVQYEDELIFQVSGFIVFAVDQRVLTFPGTATNPALVFREMSIVLC